MISIPSAIEAFVKGFCVVKSLHGPYEAVQFGPLWMMRDIDKRKNPRKSEVVSFQTPLSEAVKIGRESSPDRRWFLCAIAKLEEEEALYQEGKGLGLHLMSREGLFACMPPSAPRFEGPVERLSGKEHAERIAKAMKGKLLDPSMAEIDDAPIRAYVAWDQTNAERPAGAVQSVRVGKNSWVSGLYVLQEHRGKGLGRALMSAMLHDDARLGIEWSVLLASSAGARLYPHLGYERLGTLLLFNPGK